MASAYTTNTKHDLHDMSGNLTEDISEYVAELQLHMTLQAKNLVPSFPEEEMSATDSRVRLLRDAQADMEKLASRQEIWACRL